MTQQYEERSLMVTPTNLAKNKVINRRWLKFSVVAVFFISLSWNGTAFSTLTSSKCSNHFVGEVINMADASTPFSSLQKIKLDFFVHSRKKGATKEYEEVYYPKNGLNQFKIGDTFEVKLKDGLICSFKKV